MQNTGTMVKKPKRLGDGITRQVPAGTPSLANRHLLDLERSCIEHRGCKLDAKVKDGISITPDKWL